MTILEEIIIFKRLEVARRKSEVKVSDLQDNPLFNAPVKSMKASLKDPGKNGIIAEFKRRSPSKGVINDSADIMEVTSSYMNANVSGLSILTDEKFFGGNSGDLMKIRGHEIPILRKDFILDEYQVIETRSIGADLILLIAACLTPSEVKYLATMSKELGLEVLLEIHSEEELGHVCEEIDIIGVNNRDLQHFTTDLQTSVRLADSLPAGKMKISESGINSAEDIRLLRSCGYDGFLIGESLMRDKGETLSSMKELNSQHNR